ncbi:hypothetical protein M0802_003968 [Mischocyttarus mexicanus]|nr:hypothetical protein M0802_003968 [Mischocyttarus mexicanus]
MIVRGYGMKECSRHIAMANKNKPEEKKKKKKKNKKKEEEGRRSLWVENDAESLVIHGRRVLMVSRGEREREWESRLGGSRMRRGGGGGGGTSSSTSTSTSTSTRTSNSTLRPSIIQCSFEQIAKSQRRTTEREKEVGGNG